MTNRAHPSRAVGLALAIASAATVSAQTTHVVGTPALPQIRDALAIAASGDTILVLPGTYAQFVCDVGVTIRADVPGSVHVAFDANVLPPGCLQDPVCAGLSGQTRFQTSPGDPAHVIGLAFDATTQPLTISQHRVLVSSGRVTFDGCTIEGDSTTALYVDHAAAHLQDCVVRTLKGTAAALYVLFGHVTATGTEVRGGNNWLSADNDAVRVFGGSLVASHVTLVGGLPSFGAPGRAVNASNCEVWIADSTLTSPPATCPVLAQNTTGRIDRCTLTPATSSAGASCSTGPALPVGPVVGVARPAPPTNGATFTMQVRTEPLSLVAIHASNTLGTVTVPGLFEQPIALGLSSFWLAGVFASDANGDVVASWNLPAGQFVGTPLWLEAIAFLPTSPIQVGPIVGGIIR